MPYQHYVQIDDDSFVMPQLLLYLMDLQDLVPIYIKKKLNNIKIQFLIKILIITNLPKINVEDHRQLNLLLILASNLHVIYLNKHYHLNQYLDDILVFHTLLLVVHGDNLDQPKIKYKNYQFKQKRQEKNRKIKQKGIIFLFSLAHFLV